MTTPNQNELEFYKNKPLDDNSWKTNWLKVISWLTSGLYDLYINSLNIVNNLIVGGDVAVTGDVTADKFYGDGSTLTGLNISKNWLLNGIGQFKTYSDYTLVKDVYGQAPDYWYGMATGTAVNAGTITTITNANIGRTGYAIKFSGVTATGTGVIYLRQRMQSKDAVNFINQVASFGCYVYQDTGAAINYTVYLRKADTVDNFTSVTEIAHSSATSIANITATQLKFENVSMGNCANGIEIEIKAECGAVTLKNFEFTEMQLEIGDTSTNYEYRFNNLENAIMNFSSKFLNIATKDELTFSTATTKQMTFSDRTVLGQSNWFDSGNNRILPTEAGYYEISSNFRCSIPSGSIFATWIKKNSTEISVTRAGQNSGVGTIVYAIINAPTIVYMNGTTDYIEIYGYLGTGSVTALLGGTDALYSGYYYNYVNIKRLF